MPQPRLTSWVETRFLPNRKTRTELYRPQQAQLPVGDIKQVVFDFAGVAAFDTGEQSWPFQSTFVVWALTGGIHQPLDAGADFRVQLWHTHNERTRPLFGKHLVRDCALGTGQLPVMLRSTYLLTHGDSLLCEVTSLSAQSNSRIQVVLWGTELRQ